MKIAQDFDRIMRQEFPDVVTNLIYRDDDGTYRVFDRYSIVKENTKYRVYCSASDVGLFSSTKSALSWCIADKYRAYNLARDIAELDTKLSALTSDITARANLADRSTNVEFRETIETKLETKLIKKKQVEAQLSKCINWAKYTQQQKGFNNETVRTSRSQTIKTGR
jgi:hypothetical protein